MMWGNKYHLYPDKLADTDNTTACGRDGRKVGGLISVFFKETKEKVRCKTRNRIFGDIK